ncbi:hypothetical protein BP00DRAFT_423940 [Aspergillus indologenus CBS 114.80]|uniref:Uncharacterized protein n=1 Tax=Aspergillus indologenus CBS 114.80 TaxID=1450541 RepID=A0A2V5IBS1_9EURO|nr:hypothetical protein BP00DRAFT_423940 [Aspergillus indologenus CBS 114.80]
MGLSRSPEITKWMLPSFASSVLRSGGFHFSWSLAAMFAAGTTSSIKSSVWHQAQIATITLGATPDHATNLTQKEATLAIPIPPEHSTREPLIPNHPDPRGPSKLNPQLYRNCRAIPLASGQINPLSQIKPP